MSFERELEALRQPLLRFAMAQLRNEAAAEDAVSATLLVLLEKPAAFQGTSSLRTYATGILKHKMWDAMRRHCREVPIVPAEDQSIDEAIEALFQRDGHWREQPVEWREPDRQLERRELAAVLQRCIENLPARLARVLMLREWQEMATEEICGELGISANNCHVMLFRARMLMRTCLDTHWFRKVAS